ncbi:hypothetical protein MICRO8M_100051 [Microbacterium sp. 8M]|nr:hypothetical protein MICRO8M_100051 [Microbacterium sp. 8M]
MPDRSATANRRGRRGRRCAGTDHQGYRWVGRRTWILPSKLELSVSIVRNCDWSQKYHENLTIEPKHPMFVWRFRWASVRMNAVTRSTSFDLKRRFAPFVPEEAFNEEDSPGPRGGVHGGRGPRPHRLRRFEQQRRQR